jgi:copper chaperone CopZ
MLGLRCAGCIKNWKAFLEGIPGIRSTTIEIASSSVTITYTSEVVCSKSVIKKSLIHNETNSYKIFFKIQLQNVCEAVLRCPGCVDALLISFKAVDSCESSINYEEANLQTKSTAVLSLKIVKSNICNITESEMELLSSVTQEIVETIRQVSTETRKFQKLFFFLIKYGFLYCDPIR